MRAYVEGLGVDLSFQDVEDELAGLPGAYGAPAGAILIARAAAGRPAGCVAMRPLATAGLCEMKRLYVLPEARGLGLGPALVAAIIAAAKAAGHRRMVLDTLEDMAAAQRLYAAAGFRPTAPYYPNPLPGAVYLGLDL